MEKKTYLVLTPEKIEDIFRDLEANIFTYLNGLPIRSGKVKKVLESKKQELLKSMK